MGKTTRGGMYTGVLDDLRDIVEELEMKMRRKIPLVDEMDKGIRCAGADPMDEMDISSMETRGPSNSKRFRQHSPSRAKSAIY